jgi:hypothetical protein
MSDGARTGESGERAGDGQRWLAYLGMRSAYDAGCLAGNLGDIRLLFEVITDLVTRLDEERRESAAAMERWGDLMAEIPVANGYSREDFSPEMAKGWNQCRQYVLDRSISQGDSDV